MPPPVKEQANPTVAAPKAKRKSPVGPRSLRGRIMAGILLIIPLAVTAILINYIYSAALKVGVWLVYWVLRAVFWTFSLSGAPKQIDPANAEFEEKTVAVILTILMLYMLGWLGTNVVGRRLIDLVEGVVERIPLVATVYSAIKRMVQALSGANKAEKSMQQVVLIDFPHENMKAIAFMTNVVTDLTSNNTLATVYVPTTPNPTSGYMLIVPVERITQTDWTMEEALSMILSGGATARPEVKLYPPGSLTPIFNENAERTSGRSP